MKIGNMGGCKMHAVDVQDGTALLGRSIVEGSYPDVGEVPLATGSADVVDGSVLQDDRAEEELAQRLEDLSTQESVQSM